MTTISEIKDNIKLVKLVDGSRRAQNFYCAECLAGIEKDSWYFREGYTASYHINCMMTKIKGRKKMYKERLEIWDELYEKMLETMKKNHEFVSQTVMEEL